MVDWYNDLYIGKCKQMFNWIPTHGWKVCLGLLASVCLSVCLSAYHSVHLSSILLFANCLFRSVSFLWIYTSGFCDTWHGIRAPCGIFVEVLQKNLVWAKITKKWSKMAQKWDFVTIFKNFDINFCIKQSSCTSTILGKILFLEL